jgi:uncharacterized membrane protein YphA (DoxX/SURF4 family)
VNRIPRPPRAAWTAAALLAGLFGTLLAVPGWAHVKWFTDPALHPPGAVPWERVWLLAAVSAAAVAVAWLGERLWRRVRPPVPRDLQLSAARLERLFALMPVILGTHAAAALLASGIRMQLFAPNLPLPRDFWGALVALAQIVVALSFVYGAFTRVFAWLLVALFPAALLLFPPLDVAEHLHLLGIALYLAILGRGPYSLDGVLGRPVRPLLGWVPYAVPLLRWCTGLGLVALAFGEKLWNPDLGLAFLQRYDFNFLRAWGVPDRAFVLLAGYVEATVGVLVASGFLARLVIALAWFPFNLTLPFLGAEELVGHLPVYGVMVVLLVWGRGEDLGPYLASVRRAEESV